MPLPILQKLLGHSSVRTTALYWRDIYHGDDDDNIGGGILAGKNWLERSKPSQSKERPKPIKENFPEILKVPKPLFIEQKPIIPNKNLTHENNSLSVPKTLKKTPEISINEISSNSPAKFSLNLANKNSDQLKITQPLMITATQEQKPTKKELVLLQKIKLLESQLQASQSSLETSQNKLTEALQSKGKLKEKMTEIQKENNNLKQLLYQEKARADNYHQQLKVIIKSLYQWQKINYYKQLEQEAKIIQLPPDKTRK